MGWFDDNHWAGEAYDFGFGYMCGGRGFMSDYPSHRNPLNDHYVAGTRKCGVCKVFKTKKDFTAEEAARPPSSRVCKVCQKSLKTSGGGGSSTAGTKRKGASDQEEDDGDKDFSRVDAIVDGPRGSGARLKYQVHFFGPDSAAELRNLTIPNLKPKCVAAGVAISGTKGQLVQRIIDSESTPHDD